MKKYVTAFMVLLSCLLIGCGKQEATEPEVETPVVEAAPVEQEVYTVVGNFAKGDSFTEIDRSTRSDYLREEFVKFNTCGKYTSIFSEHTEYTSKHLSMLEAIWAASLNNLEVYIKVDDDNAIENWYAYDATFDKSFTCKEYQGVVDYLGLPTSEAKITAFGTVTEIRDSEVVLSTSDVPHAISVSLDDIGKFEKGCQYHIEANASYINNKPYWLKYNLSNCQEFDITVVSDAAIVFEPPTGYSKIKPLNYVQDDEASDLLNIKGGGSYTAKTVDDAEIIYLAYHAGVDVYVKASIDNLFTIDDYILVDNNSMLFIATADDLMQYINDKYIPDSIGGTNALKVKLLCMSSNIHVTMGVSDNDSIDERPGYSYHYAVFAHGKSKVILKYTSETLGLEYNDLCDTKGKALDARYTKTVTEFKNETQNVYTDYTILKIDKITKKKKK